MAEVEALVTFIRYDGQFIRRGDRFVISDDRAIGLHGLRRVNILRLDEGGTIAHDRYYALRAEAEAAPAPPKKQKLIPSRQAPDPQNGKRASRYRPYEVNRGISGSSQRTDPPSPVEPVGPGLLRTVDEPGS